MPKHQKAGAPAGRRIIRAAVAAAMVTVGVWQVRHVGHVLTRWWQGTLTSSSLIAGMPVRTWVRLGKLLQLAAGLTAAADIIGAERFTRWSEAFRQRRADKLNRSARLTAAQPMVELWELLCRSVIVKQDFAGLGGDGGTVPQYEIARGGPPSVAAFSGLGDTAVAGWHAATKAALAAAHTCTVAHESRWPPEGCEQQMAYVQTAAESFLRQHLPAEQCAQLQGERRRVATVGRRADLVIIGMGFAPSLIFGIHHFVPGRHAQSISAPAYVAMTVAMFAPLLWLAGRHSTVDAPRRSRLDAWLFAVLLRLETAAGVRLLQGVAALVTRARPSNALKWFAFWAFVVGFAFDCLGS